MSLLYCPRCTYPIDRHYYEIADKSKTCRGCGVRTIQEFKERIETEAKIIPIRMTKTPVSPTEQDSQSIQNAYSPDET